MRSKFTLCEFVYSISQYSTNLESVVRKLPGGATNGFTVCGLWRVPCAFNLQGVGSCNTIVLILESIFLVYSWSVGKTLSFGENMGPKRCKKGGFWRCSGKKLELYLKLAAWNYLALGETEPDREWKLDFCRSLGYDVLCLSELWNQQLESDDFVM